MKHLDLLIKSPHRARTKYSERRIRSVSLMCRAGRGGVLIRETPPVHEVQQVSASGDGVGRNVDYV